MSAICYISPLFMLVDVSRLFCRKHCFFYSPTACSDNSAQHPACFWLNHLKALDVFMNFHVSYLIQLIWRIAAQLSSIAMACAGLTFDTGLTSDQTQSPCW